MIAAQVLQRAHDAGVQLRLVGDKVGCSPPGRVTPELLAAIKKHKTEIIKKLRGPWTTDQWDVFCDLVGVLEHHPHLWSALRGYARRELPSSLVEALEAEGYGYRSGGSGPEHPKTARIECFECFLMIHCPEHDQIQEVETFQTCGSNRLSK